MNKYEILYVISTKLEDEKREELITRFANLVSQSGGEAEVSKWGIKKFAYPIKFQSEGFYVQMNFSAPQDLPLELERQMRLLDSVLRFMTVKVIENKHTVKAAAKKSAAAKAKAEAAAAAAEEAAAAEKAAAAKAKASAKKEAEKAAAEKEAEKAADVTAGAADGAAEEAATDAQPKEASAE